MSKKKPKKERKPASKKKPIKSKKSRSKRKTNATCLCCDEPFYSKDPIRIRRCNDCKSNEGNLSIRDLRIYRIGEFGE